MRESERRPLFAWLQTVDIFQWTFVFLFYQANFGWNRVKVFDFFFFFFFFPIKQYGWFRYVPIHRNISSDRTKSYSFFFVENTFLVFTFWITFHFGPHFFFLSILVPKTWKLFSIESLLSSHWQKLPTCHTKCIAGTWSAYVAIKIIKN